MAVTHGRLLELQAECLADDVDIEDRMCTWSEDAVRNYFLSGGTSEEPTPLLAEEDVASADAPDESGNELSDRTGKVSIGGVPNELSDRTAEVSIGGVTLGVHVPTASELVPWAGKDELASQGTLATMRWLMTQLALGQDMMLLADPGPRARRIASLLCSLLGREVEYVGITRDTCESDLKQRREILRGSVYYEVRLRLEPMTPAHFAF